MSQISGRNISLCQSFLLREKGGGGGGAGGQQQQQQQKRTAKFLTDQK